MYLTRSIVDGLKILSFDKETIKKVSREKSLEEIFLSTLFLNYLVVLIVFLLTIFMGGISIGNKQVNLPVFFGLLMTYPFVYNLIVYVVYGLFGVIAEMLNSNKRIKPLVATGFHTAIVYTILIYVVGLFVSINLELGLFFLAVFLLYFLLIVFLSVSTLYDFSTGQTLIVLFVPLIFIFSLLLILLIFVDARTLIGMFFI